MSWELIEQRQRQKPKAPPVPTAEQLAEREQIRLGNRQAIRAKLASADLAEKRLNEINAIIATINNRKEAAAAFHSTATAEIQAELRAIEHAQIAAIVAHESLDESQDARRKELITSLQAANEELQSTIEREDRLLANLEPERIDMATKCNRSILEMELLRHAPHELQVKIETANRSRTWAQARLNSAHDRLVQNPHNPVAMAEVEAAEKLLAQARTDSEELYARAMDE